MPLRITIYALIRFPTKVAGGMQRSAEIRLQNRIEKAASKACALTGRVARKAQSIITGLTTAALHSSDSSAERKHADPAYHALQLSPHAVEQHCSDESQIPSDVARACRRTKTLDPCPARASHGETLQKTPSEPELGWWACDSPGRQDKKEAHTLMLRPLPMPASQRPLITF